MKHIICYSGVSSYSPIWMGDRYMELSKLSEFYHSYYKGVQFLHQVFVQGHLRSFQDLQGEFDISWRKFFQYLQLRHALSAQAKITNMGLIFTHFIDSLANAVDKKELISSLNRMLLDKSLANIHLPGRIGREKDIGEIDDETWQAILDQVQLVSISPTQRLSQLFVLHRSYRTSIQLHR